MSDRFVKKLKSNHAFSGNAVAGSVEEEVRCIKKVMQVGGRL